MASYRGGPLPPSRVTPKSTLGRFITSLTYLIVIPGFFIDGVLIDLVNWAYPRPETTAQTGTYAIGDDSEEGSMSWCVASATLLSKPIGMILAFLGTSTFV
jgi:hypothetical protein